MTISGVDYMSVVVSMAQEVGGAAFWLARQSKTPLERMRFRASLYEMVYFIPTFEGTAMYAMYACRVLADPPPGLNIRVGNLGPTAHNLEVTGQSGYCGNFNGDPDDDAEPVVPSWDRPIGDNLEPVPEVGRSSGRAVERSCRVCKPAGSEGEWNSQLPRG